MEVQHNIVYTNSLFYEHLGDLPFLVKSPVARDLRLLQFILVFLFPYKVLEVQLAALQNFTCEHILCIYNICD